MLFTDFSLHERLQRAIASEGYEEPTPIQAAAIPVALTGRDIVGTAQTGTGKTAAFVLPILQHLLTTSGHGRRTRALIVAPTRELSEQIHGVISSLGRHTTLRSATVYGGVGMTPQMRALKNGTEIIVACPGRLLDHVGQGNADLDGVELLVLDEADRMLDMGFMPAIRRIMELLPAGRQTMLFSATFASELNSFVAEHLHKPERIEVGMTAPAETVAHALYPVQQHLKTALLTSLLRDVGTRSVLIFTRTKHRADKVAFHLTRAGFAAGVLHANKTQNQRQRIMESFRNGSCRYLVATDIAARGIDVSTISHVVNYDIPDTADTYIHRIGRTGRAERSGEALTLVTLDDASEIRAIERVLGSPIEKRYLDGFDYKQPAPSRAETRAEERERERFIEEERLKVQAQQQAMREGGRRRTGASRPPAPRAEAPRGEERPRMERPRLERPRPADNQQPAKPRPAANQQSAKPRPAAEQQASRPRPARPSRPMAGGQPAAGRPQGSHAATEGSRGSSGNGPNRGNRKPGRGAGRPGAGKPAGTVPAPGSGGGWKPPHRRQRSAR